ncbi:MAG: DinB family protein [Chloroflexota bacterium]|nr:DinB family protein [Chloroflexota bacterium]
MDTITTVIDRLQTAQERLLKAVERADAARWNEPSPNPGWTYKDLLAHLATGDWVCQMLLRGVLATGSVPPWPDIDAGNAELIEARRPKSVADLLQERQAHRQETLALLAQLTEAHLRVPIHLPWISTTTTFSQYLLGFPGHDLGHTFEMETAAPRHA